MTTRWMLAPFVFFALIGVIGATPSPPPSPSSQPARVDAQFGVWKILTASADEKENGDFSMPSAVFMTRDGGDITGDRASGNYTAQRATIYGHVVMHDTQGTLAQSISGASPTPSSPGPAASREPATLTADEVHIDGLGKVYVATGNMHYVQGATVADADKGMLDDRQHKLVLDGNVHITNANRSMQAAHFTYDTRSGDIHASGDVTMLAPSQIAPHIATPRPITIHNPLVKKTPSPESTPASSPTP